jgi:hypothetical protein
MTGWRSLLGGSAAVIGVCLAVPAGALGAVAWKSETVFSTPEITEPGVPLTGVEDVAIGDVTGDAIDDVVAIAHNQSAGIRDLVVLPGTGTDALGTAIHTPISGDGTFNPKSLALGDLNGDAAKDVVVGTVGLVGGSASGNVITLLADGSGGFSNQTTVLPGSLARQVQFLNANGDALPDIAAALEPDRVAIGINGGGGTITFSPALTFSLAGPVRNDLSVGDLNGGNDDIAVTTGGSVHVLLSGPGNTYSAQVLSAGPNHCAVAIGDFNSDGFGDLFDSSCSAFTGDVEAAAGNGNGSFSPLASLLSDGDVRDAVAGDFSMPADGREDLMVVNIGTRDSFPDNGRFPSLINWIRNEPDGLAVRPVTERGMPEIPGPGGAIAAGQINGDGVPDLAVATYFDLIVFRSFDDVVPPDTSVVGGDGGNGGDSGKVSRALAAKKNKLRFKANEAGSAFTCKVDKRKPKPCRSPYKLRKLKAGKHVLKIRAADLAGNRERKPAKVRIKVGRR